MVQLLKSIILTPKRIKNLQMATTLKVERPSEKVSSLMVQLLKSITHMLKEVIITNLLMVMTLKVERPSEKVSSLMVQLLKSITHMLKRNLETNLLTVLT